MVAIAVTGKPFILAAGADLSQVGQINDHAQAKLIAQIGHGVFHKLHTTDKPTFGLINGLALGGGLEIALHCDYRTVSAAARRSPCRNASSAWFPAGVVRGCCRIWSVRSRRSR